MTIAVKGTVSEAVDATTLALARRELARAVCDAEPERRSRTCGMPSFCSRPLRSTD